MTIKIDVLGHRYDDAEPAFVELEGDWYYHLKTNKRYQKDEFDGLLAEQGKAFESGEVGIPSLEYMRRNETILWSFTRDGIFVFEVTKVPSGVDDTGEITVTGSDVNDGYLAINVWSKDSTSVAATLASATSIPEDGDNGDAIAAKIAAVAHDPNFVSVVAVGNVITFTPSAGGSIEVLEVYVGR